MLFAHSHFHNDANDRFLRLQWNFLYADERFMFAITYDVNLLLIAANLRAVCILLDALGIDTRSFIYLFIYLFSYGYI